VGQESYFLRKIGHPIASKEGYNNKPYFRFVCDNNTLRKYCKISFYNFSARAYHLELSIL
jgi:hypothetical protein